jgi:hypothetical protein
MTITDVMVATMADTTFAKPDRIGPRGSARHHSAVASLRISRLLALEISRSTRETQNMQPQTARCTSHGNRELMPKKQVLDFKLAPRPKQISGKRREQTEDRKHRVE